MKLLLFADAKEEEWDGINLILPNGAELLWSAVFFFGLWALMKFVLSYLDDSFELILGILIVRDL